MERADQQLKDNCTTNPVSCLSLFYSIYRTDCFVFYWENSPEHKWSLQYISLLPSEGIYTGQCGISVGEKQTKEMITSIMNVNLGVIEK